MMAPGPSAAAEINAVARRLEIEIGIMGRRSHAGKLVGQQRTEAGTRLHARVPVLDLGKFVPRHVAAIVDGREMGRAGDVGQRERIAAEPAPRIGQPGEIGGDGRAG